MRRLILAALLLSATPALAQTPVFTSIQAGNLALNVKGAPYNAKCDGTTDDTAAIQSAIAAGVASGQSFTLLLPAGVCKTTAALTITGATGQNVAIKGESRATSQLLVAGTGDGIDVTMNQGGSTGIFGAMLDVSDFTMLATGTAGTAIKATSSAPNATSPKFRNLRIGYLSGGSFANGITTAHMSNIMVHEVNINSPNATGYAFQFDGDSTFPSITDNFSDIYFWGFATGIQIGNGTTSHVQGVEISNAQLQQNGGSCIAWNATGGFLGDMLLVSNSFCNGGMNINDVEDVVITGNYFLAGGITNILLTTTTTYTVNGNTFLAGGTANSTGISVISGFGTVIGNHFYLYQGTNSAAIIFASTASNSVAVDNLCTTCATENVVNDFGHNFQRNNINTSALSANQDNITNLITGQQTWRYIPGATPTFTLEGAVLGWNYAVLGESDWFLSPGTGPGGMNWYAASGTTGAVGSLLMSLNADGSLSPSNGVRIALLTVAGLPTCNSANKGLSRAVSDATAPTYGATLTGGGAVSVPVYCNGTAWTAH